MRIEKTEPVNTDADMTPMIDVVFQLIAFFMVIINFEITQADERVKLPESDIARPSKSKPEDKLVLNVGYLRNKDGSLRDPDPYVFYSGTEIRIKEMASRLEAEAEFFEPNGTTADGNLKAQVVIRADGDVPTGLVQELMQMCQKAKFENFSLKAQAEEP